MKFTLLTAALSTLLASTSLAAPTPAPGQTVVLNFNGATPEATYSITVPADGSVFQIYHPEISVSHINILGEATCVINGVDGSSTFVAFRGTISNNVDVGPPQVQVSGTCNGY